MAERTARAFLIVMDGVGIGSAPDAFVYGDEGSDTLGNLSREVGGLSLPNFQRLGLGVMAEVSGVDPVDRPTACVARLQEVSAGKDSVTGHWELCGLVTEKPFRTYPKAFPPEVVELVERIAGATVLGNEVASGTEIMDRLGAIHMQTGQPILYTSADSVLQILAHEEILPLAELYRICEGLRRELVDPHKIARVIARPFIGRPGEFQRTANRRDYALEPHGVTLLDLLQQNGIPVRGIGKVDTLFAGRGFTSATKTKNNAEGIERILECIKSDSQGLIFANLLDFDTQWGHRNDVPGFAKGMVELDTALGDLLSALRPDDLVILTADHGNDPTTPSTDHSRENVPFLAWKGRGGQGRYLGVREGFMDVAATVAEHLGLQWQGKGASLLSCINGDHGTVYVEG